MQLSTLDWGIIVAFFIFSLIIGAWSSRRSGKSTEEFFLSGRNMPWWLLGISMVATTFSADTPNLVTDLVRQNGVSGNWVWWAFLLTGMLTVFVYARLWRRSGVLTDLEFYELRYSGKPAAFLRGFRSLYLGVIFNIIIMASVTLAAIKIAGVMLGLQPWQTVLIAGSVTVVYSTLGGLRGILITDFFQFALAMIGSIWAVFIVLGLPEIDGLNNLLAHPNVSGKLNFVPDFNNWELLIPVFIIPLAVQWWSVWYPGSEPGGGGFVAQRMLSARTEKNAMGASLLFNIAHYALRPWPWILIALASLIIFPDLDSLRSAFPHIPEDKIGDDLAYSAMLTFLPAGLMGLVMASLVAAYMSTISTLLNWGSSYVVHDFYKRFIKQDATQKEQVMVGRVSIVLLMVVAGGLSLALGTAVEAFNILLQIGAGTGLIFILRWFWWRINAFSEISAMIISFLLALLFAFGPESISGIADHWKLCLGVLLTTIGWVVVTLMTPHDDMSKLSSFYKLIKPAKLGWKPVLKANPELKSEPGQLPLELLATFLGILAVYTALFGTGFLIYGNTIPGLCCYAGTAIGAIGLMRIWKQLKTIKSGSATLKTPSDFELSNSPDTLD